MGWNDFLGGAGTGAGIGATFGPVGAGIGGALGALGSLIFGGKNKPTEYTSGLDPQAQQFRTMLGQYLQQKMQQPWLTAQPSMTTPNMLNMLYGQYFRTPQGNPMTFNMPGLMYGGQSFGMPYQGPSGISPARTMPSMGGGGYRSNIPVSAFQQR